MDNGVCELLAVISNKGLNKALQLKLQVQILKFNLSEEDIVLINLDDKVDDYLIEKTTASYKILFSDAKRMIVGVGRNKIANIPIPGRHGHFVHLIPDDTLLSAAKHYIPIESKTKSEVSLSKTTSDILDKWPSSSVKIGLSNENFQSLLELKLDGINSDSLIENIKRYSGVSDLDSEGKIKSRHCLHPDNRRIIQSLAFDLEQTGYFVNVWEFQTTERPPGTPPTPGVEGATFYNVIAELPGVGDNSLLENDLSSMIRDIFIRHPNPLQDESWISEIKALVGERWFNENNLQSLSPLDLKRSLEKTFGLDRWSNWWIKDKDVPGLGSEIVIIGCHMDSTANLIRNESRNYWKR
jgi:hypothetical protein